MKDLKIFYCIMVNINNILLVNNINNDYLKFVNYNFLF